MRIIVAALLLCAFISTTDGFKTNRTSCFHYVSCLEAVESNLKECAGGSAISLTLEAKDVNIRDLVKYRALEFVGCQDRLLKEVVDFEALQLLVNEDARECFEKLPESSKRVEQFTDSCDYVQPLSRNSSKGDALQCLIEFKQDREYCESLLECCPDHTRCGERMNAVSLSYQNARVKAEQIVYSMISCIVVNDPRFLREGARLQALRDPYRNAGVPFLRPDAYTEARITRRLALTSTATLSQRRERFLKKYTQIRQVVAQNLVAVQKPVTTTTTALPAPLPVEDVVTETSSSTTEVPEAPKAPEAVAEEVTEAPEVLETTTIVEQVEKIKKTGSEMHVDTIRSLIRNASDRDLSKYVALISEGKFNELFELAEQKKFVLEPKMDEKLSAKMLKLKELISETLEEKSSEEKPLGKPEKLEKPELEEMEAEEETKETSVKDPAVFTIADDVQKKGEARLANTVVDRTSRNVAESENEVKEQKEDQKEELKDVDSKNIDDAKEVKKVVKVEDEKEQVERALLVESEIKSSADQSKTQTQKLDGEALKSAETMDTSSVTDDLPVLEKEESGEKKEEVTSTTKAPELLSNSEDVLTVSTTAATAATAESEVEGSGEEDVTTLATVTLPVTPTSEVIDNVKRIRPRTEQTHCQEYASCWQTVIDYEQQCDRKYSTEVLSHGIDDSEILNILHNSSISHHEIVLKACLRPLDRSVHSTLKQLLVIQRGVRKACLELGRNKIAVTDAEEALCQTEIPTTASIDEYISSVHVRSQANHLTCRAKLEPIREACTIVRGCCASVDTCDNYISSSPVKKLETEAIRRLVKKQNDCETKMLQTLSYIHEQLSNPSRRRRFYYH